MVEGFLGPCEEQGSTEPPESIRQLLARFWRVPALIASARLGIAPLLSDDPISVNTLAGSAGVRVDRMLRFLRAVESLGVWRECSPGYFVATAETAALQPWSNRNVLPWLALLGQQWYQRSWDRLDEALVEGRPRHGDHVEQGLFDFLEGSEEARSIFHGDLKEAALSREQVRLLPIGAVSRIADLGCGLGWDAIEILNRFPRAEAVLVDLPETLKCAQLEVEGAGVSGRCTFDSRSFFEGVPTGADIYLLKFVLHDWDDRGAIRILEACKREMEPVPGSRLLIVEHVLDHDGYEEYVAFSDLAMLALTGGKERSAAEYGVLLSEAGLIEHSRVELSGSLMCLCAGVSGG